MRWLFSLVLVACDHNGVVDSDGRIAITKPELTWWYADRDADGYGDPGSRVLSDSAPSGMVVNRLDCDDEDADIYPGAPEYCDGRDENCDGEIDNDAIDEVAWYLDEDGDGYGLESSERYACTQGDGYAFQSGDCDDANPEASPGEEEICGDGFDNDCSGSDGRCRPEGWVELANVESMWIGAEEGDFIGEWLSTGPDVTGDGEPDILIGATQRWASSSQAGGAYIISQVSAGMHRVGEVGVRIWGEEYRWGGWRVLLLPDLSGDDVGEVVFPANRYDEACVFYGPILDDRLASQADACIQMESGISSEFGYAAAFAGDQSGDGVGDLVVTGTGNIQENGVWSSWVGRAYVFYGPLRDGMDAGRADARLMVDHANANAYFGRSVCSGDITADGVSELVLGAPMLGSEWVPSYLEGGLVFVVEGPVEGDLRLDDGQGNGLGGASLWRGESFHARAGDSVSCGRDVNGDGREDVLVAAPDSDEGYGVGRVYLLLDPASGDHSLAEADWRFSDENTMYGASVSLMSDMDGDGFSDVLIGSPASEPDEAGRVLVFYGGDFAGQATPDAADATVVGDPSAGTVGTQVTGGADLDGDGFEDALIGNPGHGGSGTLIGAVYLLSGGVAW